MNGGGAKLLTGGCGTEAESLLIKGGANPGVEEDCGGCC